MSSKSALALACLIGIVVGASVVLCLPISQRRDGGSPVTVSDLGAQRWILRSQHFPFGMPRVIDERYDFTPVGSDHSVPGVSVLVREGFVIGHCDRFKVPLWVSYRWDTTLRAESERVKSPRRNFREDPELPVYARAQSGYRNSGAVDRFDRGHMARLKDNVAWGEDNAEMGNMMSNIVPQAPALNERSWLALEEAHHQVGDKGHPDQLWVVAGAIFEHLAPMTTVGNDIGVPRAMYKVLCWVDRSGEVQARGYLYHQADTDIDPSAHLVPITEIESEAGLSFFPELPAEKRERIVRSHPQSMW